MNPENVEDVKLKTQFFIEAVARLLRREGRSDGEFIFGSTPTLLDAVATAFLSRLADADQKGLAEDALVWNYHEKMTETEAWKETLHGRKTIWKLEDGPAEKWQPL